MTRFFFPVTYAAVSMVMFALLLPAGADAGEPVYSISLGAEYASGDYGTGIRTDSVTMPLTLAVYPTTRLDFSLELPFVYQSTSAVVAGVMTGMQGQQAPQMGPAGMASSPRGRGGGMGGGMGPGMGGGMGPGPRTSASPLTIGDSQYGLGDMTFKAGYVLYTEEEYVPAIRPNFSVKFPTGDKNRFLGTGAFSEGFGVELSKWFDKWLADGEVGYAIQGKSTVLAVRNYIYYGAGIGYQVSDRFRPMLMLKGRSSPVEGATGQMEARLRVKYQFARHTGIDGYLAKGIMRASPDYGTGLAIVYEF